MAETKRIVDAERTPEHLLERGRAFADVGDLTRAEQYLAAALDAGADEKVVLPLLLRVCVSAKRYRVAIGYAEPALSRHPQDFRLRMVIASLHAAVDEFDIAKQQLEIVLQTHPDEAGAHYALAVILHDELHQLVDADAHFREYLRLAPDGPHAPEAKAALLKEVKPVESLQKATP
jgi:tetratricopeptide (TPR) repeat protein